MKRPRGRNGGARPRAVVVTVTVAEFPGNSDIGLTEQCVAMAGREQDKLTGAEKPPVALTKMTLVKVAVWPALMVAETGPGVEMEKSVEPVTVKFIAFDLPAA